MPFQDEQVKAAVDGLLTHPEKFVGVEGTYADGYIDGLLDLLKELGLFTLVPFNYLALREAALRGQPKL